MELENHKEEVPFAHYREKFAAMDALEAAQRTGIRYENATFFPTLLGVTYAISHPDYAICAAQTDCPALALTSLPAQTFLLRILLEGKQTPASSQFLTFRELPWGEVYIKPFTGRVLTRAAFSLGTRLDAFRAAAQRLGGLALPHGDAGYEFAFFDSYRLRLLVWEGDDEFPPNAQLLYSANFAEGFAAEDRVVAGDLLLNALKQLMQTQK